MPSKKFWIIIGMIVVVLLFVHFVGSIHTTTNSQNSPALNDRSGGNTTSLVASDFKTKIVYDSANASNTAPFIKDCNARGGTFKECGSPCPPDIAACVDVCAYTCENISK